MERQVSVLPTKRTLACQASIAESSSVPWDFEIETFNEREQKLANYIPVFAMLPVSQLFLREFITLTMTTNPLIRKFSSS
ncbi:hypothetical protein ZIOFF_020354 [Zingiber officinale]|uniref:Uncharacterized protein n=1 Tax=Zingiber officinale TaxID=94328 RepID=A0A8J5LIQ1_ZINOF|nr:hypothetical protein ZIOFF_020354 [Zingiber officinale]